MEPVGEPLVCPRGPETSRESDQWGRASDSDFTRITCYPDFPKFGMVDASQSLKDLFKRRAVDLSVTCPGLKVVINGEPLNIGGFSDYVKLFQPLMCRDLLFRWHSNVNSRWEIEILVFNSRIELENVALNHNHMAFVNSIHTSTGGTHVNHVRDQIVDHIYQTALRKLENKEKDSLKKEMIRGRIFLFMAALIDNPAFSNQTKDKLQTQLDNFGSTCIIPDDQLDEIINCGIVGSLVELVKARHKEGITDRVNKESTTNSKHLMIKKLCDAHYAGTKKSQECTLILVEGDSAMTFATNAGLTVLGRDYFGAFPLRGKLMNVREVAGKTEGSTKGMENKEILNIFKILGLKLGQTYDSTERLRYGRVIFMMDQDLDGSHIKGLLINLFAVYFPQLLEIPGFFKEFVTPLVRVTKGPESLLFFGMQDYENWLLAEKRVGWKAKYFKGLGTNDNKLGKEYFKDLGRHLLQFVMSNSEHNEQTQSDVCTNDFELIDMAFNSSRTDDRKSWIDAFDESQVIDHNQSQLTYADFIQRELVAYSHSDVMRSIPSMVDGFKPSLRKIMWSAFKRKSTLTSEVKVASLGAYCASVSEYHHAELSLYSGIISLAQDFAGSNNLNLLEPIGQFGSRQMNGKDSAAPRYIFTKQSPLTRSIFVEADDPTLDYLVSDGTIIEPRWYMPIIPMVLVNKCWGIGTGYSSFVPNFNPVDIIHRIKSFLRGELFGNYADEDKQFMPWYRDYKGTFRRSVNKDGQEQWECFGIICKRTSATVEITEIPIGESINDYKQFLAKHMVRTTTDGKKTGFIDNFSDYSTENSVHFVVTLNPRHVKRFEEHGGLLKAFNLRTTLSKNVMYLLDWENKPKKYEYVSEILHDFCQIRLQMYEERKNHMLMALEKNNIILANKIRFVEAVISERLPIRNRPAKDILVQLEADGYDKMTDLHDKYKVTVSAAPEDPPSDADLDDDVAITQVHKKDYEYLLSLKLWQFSSDLIEKLENEKKQADEELQTLKATSLSELWDRDLDKLLIAIQESNVKRRKAAKESNLHNIKEEGQATDGYTLVLGSNTGVVKRIPASSIKSKQSGFGIRVPVAAKNMEFKRIQCIVPCHDNDFILIFTKSGCCFQISVMDINETKRTSNGTALKDMIAAIEGCQATDESPAVPPHQVACFLSLSSMSSDSTSIMVFTKNGLFRKIPLKQFSHRKTSAAGSGFQLMSLEGDDEIISCSRCTQEDYIFTGTRSGLAACLSSAAILPNRTKKAMNLKEGDSFVGGMVIDSRRFQSGKPVYVCLLLNSGAGKRLSFDQIPQQAKAGSRGIVVIKPKSDEYLAAFCVTGGSLDETVDVCEQTQPLKVTPEQTAEQRLRKLKNPYHLFSSEKREGVAKDIEAQCPGWDSRQVQSEALRQIGKLWGALSPEEKAVYADMHQENKRVFCEENGIPLAPPEDPDPRPKQPPRSAFLLSRSKDPQTEWENVNEAQREALNQEVTQLTHTYEEDLKSWFSRHPEELKKHLDSLQEPKPSKPKNAKWVAFDDLKLRDPSVQNLPVTEKMSAVQAHWKSLSEVEQNQYTQTFDAENEIYQTALQEWNLKYNPSATLEPESVDEEDQAPKRPRSTWLMFMERAREQALLNLKTSGEDSTFKSVITELGRLFKCDSTLALRTELEETRTQLMEAYHRDLAEYQKERGITPQVSKIKSAVHAYEIRKLPEIMKSMADLSFEELQQESTAFYSMSASQDPAETPSACQDDVIESNSQLEMGSQESPRERPQTPSASQEVNQPNKTGMLRYRVACLRARAEFARLTEEDRQEYEKIFSENQIEYQNAQDNLARGFCRGDSNIREDIWIVSQFGFVLKRFADELPKLGRATRGSGIIKISEGDAVLSCHGQVRLRQHDPIAQGMDGDLNSVTGTPTKRSIGSDHSDHSETPQKKLKSG